MNIKIGSAGYLEVLTNMWLMVCRSGKLHLSSTKTWHTTHRGHMWSTSTSPIPLWAPSAGSWGSHSKFLWNLSWWRWTNPSTIGSLFASFFFSYYSKWWVNSFLKTLHLPSSVQRGGSGSCGIRTGRWSSLADSTAEFRVGTQISGWPHDTELLLCVHRAESLYHIFVLEQFQSFKSSILFLWQLM